MKAVYECMLNVESKDKSEQEEYVKMIIEHNYEDMKTFIEFDEDLFRFGGDIDLTEDEKKIKIRMQKLKEDYEDEKTKDPKKSDMETRRKKLSKDIDDRLQELKESRTQNYLMFGCVFVIMILFTVCLWKKGGTVKQLIGSEEDLQKQKDMIMTEKQKIENMKTKLKAMEEILVAKMKELKLDQEIEELQNDEKIANSKIKNIKNYVGEIEGKQGLGDKVKNE